MLSSSDELILDYEFLDEYSDILKKDSNLSWNQLEEEDLDFDFDDLVIDDTSFESNSTDPKSLEWERSDSIFDLERTKTTQVDEKNTSFVHNSTNKSQLSIEITTARGRQKSNHSKTEIIINDSFYNEDGTAIEPTIGFKITDSIKRTELKPWVEAAWSTRIKIPQDKKGGRVWVAQDQSNPVREITIRRYPKGVFETKGYWEVKSISSLS
jgi:hypothetical protein